MDNSTKILIVKNRLAILENNGKNIKSPGVINKLKRQLRLLNK